MNTVLNLLSAAAVVISGAVASTAPTIDTGAHQTAQIKTQPVPTFEHQTFANSATRTAAYTPAADTDEQPTPSLVDLTADANQRWVF
ncbi:hypothetical protein ACIGCM_16540 [Pseudomonas sp. NPDC078700]|uniref:hypothetical protein n=1 Tax=Pseudomonas sp. NPDC078700 TaxID=3364424 RepID=UPI0037CC8F99